MPRPVLHQPRAKEPRRALLARPPGRIDERQRVVAREGVEIRTVVEAARIALQEAPDARIVGARTVLVGAGGVDPASPEQDADTLRRTALEKLAER